jgi:HTH-type transcriptional regulator / antitoxin HigA
MTFNPDWVSPPADTIRDCLEERRITVQSFARRLRRPIDFVQRLLENQEAIDATLADDLSRVFGVEAQFWINRQANYDKRKK